MLTYIYYLCVKVFVHDVSDYVFLFTLSVVGNLVVLVYHVHSVLYSNWNITPILKSSSILHSNGR